METITLTSEQTAQWIDGDRAMRDTAIAQSRVSGCDVVIKAADGATLYAVDPASAGWVDTSEE